jgi:hypothetical protein
MPELNLSQAARLYGMSRMTLHRHCRAGRITSRLSEDNQRLIDLSELIRAYGEPPNAVTPDTGTDTPLRGTPDTGGDTALLKELRALREEVSRLREEIREIRLLPAPGTTLDGTDQPNKSIEKGPVEGFGDLLSRWEKRRS